MMDMNGIKPTKKLAWAILTKGSQTSTSEVIKVTDHEEATKQFLEQFPEVKFNTH